MCDDVSRSENLRPFSERSTALIAACPGFNTCRRRLKYTDETDGSKRWSCACGAWIDGMTKTGMSEVHRDLIAADRLGGRKLDHDAAPMQVVEALLEKREVTLADGARLTGRESLVALMGSRGIGKTLAAAYLLSRMGGRFLLAYRLARPGLDLDDLALDRRPLVIDSLGREYQQGRFALAQLEEIIEVRRGRRALTVLTANMTREQFAGAYDGILDDRLNEDAAFVVVYGKSRRGDA